MRSGDLPFLLRTVVLIRNSWERERVWSTVPCDDITLGSGSCGSLGRRNEGAGEVRDHCARVGKRRQGPELSSGWDLEKGAQI